MVRNKWLPEVPSTEEATKSETHQVGGNDDEQVQDNLKSKDLEYGFCFMAALQQCKCSVSSELRGC